MVLMAAISKTLQIIIIVVAFLNHRDENDDVPTGSFPEYFTCRVATPVVCLCLFHMTSMLTMAKPTMMMVMMRTATITGEGSE
jgi:hypothetical protein